MCKAQSNRTQPTGATKGYTADETDRQHLVSTDANATCSAMLTERKCCCLLRSSLTRKFARKKALIFVFFCRGWVMCGDVFFCWLQRIVKWCFFKWAYFCPTFFVSLRVSMCVCVSVLLCITLTSMFLFCFVLNRINLFPVLYILFNKSSKSVHTWFTFKYKRGMCMCECVGVCIVYNKVPHFSRNNSSLRDYLAWIFRSRCTTERGAFF